MRFMISDNTELDSRFGKWHYTHDDGVRTWTDGERLCLYFGYGIEREITEHFREDPNTIKDINGKFCVVMLWQDSMRVWVDYFCQTKVYYHTRDGLTVTNHLPSLPLGDDDVDQDSIRMFSRGWGEGESMYSCKSPENMRYMDRWHDFSASGTVFRDVASIPRDHGLVHVGGRTSMERLHDTQANNLRALRDPLPWGTTQLEDHVHECMEQHSAVIRREYSNICSSVSEGVDSVLQDHYFDDAVRLMYHPDDPGAIAELPPKQEVIAQYGARGREIRFDRFDVAHIADMTRQGAQDPMLSYLDTVPTLWQLRSLTPKPDVLLYGQCADEMFMHVPKFLLARVPPQHRHRYHDCYGGRKSPARPFRDPYPGVMPADWRERFSHMAVPNLYNRDVENQTGVLTTSLYADRRIFNTVHRAPPGVQLDSMAHVRPQRHLLRDRHGFDFRTPTKDGAGYECREVLRELLTEVVARCVR
jgi:hypothetical protein